ncbi:hypothetical protein CEXT_237721 [Caerostris extrusa]|uniref:Secreted protein n=1 Tax=Caerostris extrusa TaxID=172846 RepID=A0AAV4WTL4_CAEEX|nr:hypothetical protein CEXT_237721 [Caerostris extrusa]
MIIKSPMVLFTLSGWNLFLVESQARCEFSGGLFTPRQRRTQQKNAAAIRSPNSLNWDFLIRFQFRVYSAEQKSAIILTFNSDLP